MSSASDSEDRAMRRRRIVLRAMAFVVVTVAVAVVWTTHQFLTERFTETTRNRAEVRMALYTGNLMSELQRNSVVPLLLARDPALTGALDRGDYSVTSQRLINLQDELGTASILFWMPKAAPSPRPTATVWAPATATSPITSRRSAARKPSSPRGGARPGATALPSRAR